MAKTLQQPLCPRCKGGLRLVVESELKPRETVVKYLYVCDVCRYRQINESVILRMDGDKLLVTKISSTRHS